MDFDQKLDQRVKALEYEIKILKNEIQRTLLDVQEQILVHYYPDLRSEGGSADQEGAMHAIEAIATKKAQMDSTAKVAQKAAAAKAKAAAPPEPIAPVVPVMPELAAELDDDEDDANSQVVIKPISLDQVRASGDSAPTGSGAVEAASHDQVAALSAWTTDTVSHIGAERTVTIIASAVRRGMVPADSQVFLERLAAMGDDANVPEKLAINHVLNAVLGLQQAAGQETNPEDAINLIDEANLG